MSEFTDGTRRIFSPPGVAYFAPDPDSEHDQGDEPDICPPCGAGRHDGCRDGAELGGDDVEDCDCRDGDCGGGEWIELGAVDADILPLDTPAPPPFRLLRAAPPRWVTEQESPERSGTDATVHT